MIPNFELVVKNLINTNVVCIQNNIYRFFKMGAKLYARK